MKGYGYVRVDNACEPPHLNLSGAVVHHRVLGSHGGLGVEEGGVEWNLLHVGDGAQHIGLSRARGVELVLPVPEELLEQGALAPCCHDIHLHVNAVVDSYYNLRVYILMFSTRLYSKPLTFKMLKW